MRGAPDAPLIEPAQEGRGGGRAPLIDSAVNTTQSSGCTFIGVGVGVVGGVVEKYRTTQGQYVVLSL